MIAKEIVDRPKDWSIEQSIDRKIERMIAKETEEKEEAKEEEKDEEIDLEDVDVLTAHLSINNLLGPCGWGGGGVGV